MDIAMLSMMKSQQSVSEAASLAVMKMAMNTSKGNADSMVGLINDSTRMIERSAQPHLGAKLDVTV